MSEFPTLDSVLLVCLDLQPAFLQAMSDPVQLEKRARFAIAAAKGLGLRTVFTEQVPGKLGKTLDTLVAEAGPQAPVFGKTAFSALKDPGFDRYLNDSPVSHLLVCGLETPVCVYQTAADALQRELGVTILADAIGARRPDDAQAALAELARAGAHVLSSESVFYALLGDANHPFFRSYTQLVKAYA